VLYDNLNLTNVSGRLNIKDETATVQNLTSDIFDGKLNVNGAVSTKSDIATFDMALGIDGFKIGESFKSLELFKALAPIADALKVKPFTLNYKDIAINVDGSHNFASELQYKATLDVPAKYLGSEVNNLIAKIDDSDLEGLTIPITANFGGNITSPQVQTDLTSGVKQLTARLVEIQKQKLINKGKKKAEDLLTDVLRGDKSDSTQTDSTATNGGSAVKDVLGGLLGGDKKDSVQNSDSTSTQTDAKKAAKDILGGLFGKKKKDSTEQN